MASASLDVDLDAEVGSYWGSHDFGSGLYDDCSSLKDVNASKLRRTTSKMLERMSSRPWLRRMARKTSQGSLTSMDADSLSHAAGKDSIATWGTGEDDEADTESHADGVSVIGDADHPWLYNESSCCPIPLPAASAAAPANAETFSRTFASCSEPVGMEGLYERAERCPSHGDDDDGGMVEVGSQQPQQQQASGAGRMSQCSLPTQAHAGGGGLRKTAACDSRLWLQASTASLPLALAYSSRSFSHISAAGDLPCHCPACCLCSSSSCSFPASDSSAAAAAAGGNSSLRGTYPRRRGRKACPLRSSLEFKVKRSHPGSAGCLSSAGSMDSGASGGHDVATRQSSAPGCTVAAMGRSHSPSTSLPSLCQQVELLQRGRAEAGSVQTICGEKALLEVDESVPSRVSPPYWMDGRVYKERVENMLDWFADFSDQQRNLFLESLLDSCGVSQMHYLSSALEPVLHKTCPHNCQDLLSWLPMTISWHILSFLDPVGLCRASQVSRSWYALATEPVLWRHLSRMPHWRPSELESQRLLGLNTCSESGFVDWKQVFSEMYRLRRNWLQGRFTVRTFAGHTSGISCVQFDDTRIVSGSSDRTIKVWDIRTNTPWCALTLVGHSATVRCLHLCDDQLVSGSADCTIKVWDLSMDASGCWSSAACRVTMIGHLHTVRCLKVDDTKVVSGSYDMTLKVWDLKSGRCLNTLRGHTGAVICLQYDEERIVSGSADNSIKVWQLSDGACLMTLVGHQDAVTCLQLSGEMIISGSVDCAIKFWSLTTGQCVQTLDWIRSEGHRGVVRDLQADKWKIVSAADDKTLKVWSIASCQRLLTLRCHTDGVTCLQFNDRRIVSGSYDKTVKLYDFSAC